LAFTHGEARLPAHWQESQCRSHNNILARLEVTHLCLGRSPTSHGSTLHTQRFHLVWSPGTKTNYPVRCANHSRQFNSSSLGKNAPPVMAKYVCLGRHMTTVDWYYYCLK